MNINFLYSLNILFILFFFTAKTSASGEIKIQQTITAPVIDGRLDDSAWNDATWHNNFTQVSPVAYATPSVKTSLALLYDNTHLYFALKCYGSDQVPLTTRLVPRDIDGDFDKIEIILSPSNDKKTAMSFIVNPSGSIQDGKWMDNSIFDRSWDALFYAQTQIYPDHWTAEIAIPLAELRMSQKLQSFGFQVKRWVSSLHENIYLFPKDPADPGEITALGQMTETEKIEPRTPLYLRPEAYLSYRNKNQNYESIAPQSFEPGLGGYIKAGLSTNLVLDMALMPDFAQIETDEAVLNLSNIETRYLEKRPFFQEGSELFTTPFQLFYSRRLGRKPDEPALEENETITKGPITTQILGATKITGQTDDGLFVAALHALTMPTEFEIIDTASGVQKKEQGQPWTHNTVLRARQHFNRADIGLLGTLVLPETGEETAHSLGVDWNFFSPNRHYLLAGQTAFSFVDDPNTGFDNGSALILKLQKSGGEHFRTSLAYDFRDSNFNPNKLGYLDRNDLHDLLYIAEYRQVQKRGAILELYTGFKLHLQWNTSNLPLKKAPVLYISTKWKNQMWTHLGGYLDAPFYDDLEIEDGPALKRPRGAGGWMGFSSPASSKIGFNLNANLGTDDLGYYYIFKPALLLRLSRFEFELGSRLNRSKDRLSFVENIEETPENVSHVAAYRKLTQISTGLKTTFTFFNELSAHLNISLLTASVVYNNYKQVISKELTTDYNMEQKADFASSILQLQFLLRYEYRPGKIVFFSYSRNTEDETLHSKKTLANALKTTNHTGEHLFLIKLSHLFSL